VSGALEELESKSEGGGGLGELSHDSIKAAEDFAKIHKCDVAIDSLSKEELHSLVSQLPLRILNEKRFVDAGDDIGTTALGFFINLCFCYVGDIDNSLHEHNKFLIKVLLDRGCKFPVFLGKEYDDRCGFLESFYYVLSTSEPFIDFLLGVLPSSHSFRSFVQDFGCVKFLFAEGVVERAFFNKANVSNFLKFFKFLLDSGFDKLTKIHGDITLYEFLLGACVDYAEHEDIIVKFIEENNLETSWYEVLTYNCSDWMTGLNNPKEVSVENAAASILI
jgi:hypothetical protein